MNTVAYVPRLCCGGAEAAWLPALGKAAASRQRHREHPAERPGGFRPAHSPPRGDKGWEGAATGLSHHRHAPRCLSPNSPPSGSPLGWRQGGGRCRFPDSTVPGGTSAKPARSRPSPPGAVSSGRGRELGAVSINSPCPKPPRARGGGGWAGGARAVPLAGTEETRCPAESSPGSACFSQTGLLISQDLLRKKKKSRK